MSNVKAMIKKNYEISKSLNEENNKIYTDILCYLRTSMPETVKTEEIISDILDMFLSGQYQGKSAKDIIGNDYKLFCDSIIESVEINSFSIQVFKENALLIVNCFFILLTINVIFEYIPLVLKSGSITNYGVSAGFIINSIIITSLATGIVMFVGKNSFNLSGEKGKKYYFALWLGLSIIFFLIIIISLKFSKYYILSINPYFVFIAIILYWIFRLVKNFNLTI
ncbi:MAG: DUF1129 family protein [Solirubrobacterales bacterium]